ncbi:TonB-dependent receptor [Wenyingzhuangia sp. IMCC45467]
MKKFLLIFYLFTVAVFSQENRSLKQVLNQLSKTYNIDFSYNENQVRQFNHIQLDSETGLKASLISLSLQTQLVFEKIDDENYIIRNKSEEKINICGQVFSATNNEKLPIANVYLGDINILANSNGMFKLKDVLKEDIITIKVLGYQQINIAVKDFNTNCKSIFLKEEIHQLTEVVITDYLTTGFSKKNDGSIVLNPKNSGILPGVIEPDVLQSLQLIPGVQSPDETASGIHIRGSTPDQNLVVFDGMKMYHFSHYFGLISAFNPYITNNIKLYRSGTHAKYGNNVGGVLDISTDNYAPNKLSVGLGTTLTHSDFFIKAPFFNNKVGFVFSARRSITDIFNSYTNQQYAKVAFQNSKISDGLDSENLKITNADNNFFYEDYHSKIIVEPNTNNKISFSYLYNLNDLNFTGNNLRGRVKFMDDIFIENTGFHVDWSLGNVNKGMHKIAFGKTGFIKNYDGSRVLTRANGSNESVFFYKSNNVKETSAEYLFTKKLNQYNKWEFGYQFSYNNLTYNFNRITPQQADLVNDEIDGKATNHAVFSEYQIDLKNKWLINVGLRWQHFKGIDKNYIEPRFNLNYKANSALNLKFSTELKHQSVAQVVDFRNDGLGGLFDRFWTLSNHKQFPVLQSFQTSIGADYQKNNWVFDVELYHKKIAGILFLFDEKTRGQKYFNGDNYIKGIDVLIKKEWNNYNTWVSYSLSKSIYQFKDLNDGNEFNGSYDAPHNFIWSHNYSIKKVEFSLGWRFRSGIPYTVKTAELNNNNKLKVVFKNLNTERLPNYKRLDFSTRYKFCFNKDKNIKGQLGLTLQNIFNRKNILSRDYEIQTIVNNEGQNNTDKEILVETDKISLGFVPNISLRVNF